jgi:carbamoyltransferase
VNILGINFGHDSAASLIQNGKIIFSIEEEKISRIKQDFGWPLHAVDVILSESKLTPSDIDIIAFGGFSYKELGPNEIRFRFAKKKSLKNKEYFDRILSYVGISAERFGQKNKKIFEEEVVKRGFAKAKIVFYNHHLCHASGAYYCAPFYSDLVITCDGQGDGECFNFYINHAAKGLYPIVINRHDVSVGAFYSCITELLGFRPTRHEGKITGLAAYGKHSPLVDEFYKLFRYANNVLKRFPFEDLTVEWKKYILESNLSLTKKINLETSESSTGSEYNKRYELLKTKIAGLIKNYSKEDVAFACQKIAERIVVEEVKRVINIYFNETPISLSLAGGVFANVRINQMLYELEEVSNIFIQPAMGDSGLSLGAVILADIEYSHLQHLTTQYQFPDTYIGPDYNSQIEAFINEIKHESEIRKMDQPAKEIAQMINNNLVVGFWHGSMEWGPRALGKRSMILNTFDRTVNDSVNKRLSRTEFMPFAPSIIDYMMKTYIPKYDPNCPAADYMTITYDVAKEFHEQLQAVVHVDGTARPQTVRKETNPYYYEIIDEFYKLTGCGAIVNTSFNAHEEPIVSTPMSAFKALKENRIDVLILNNYKVILINQ